MDNFNLVRRRTNDFLQNTKGRLPSMPQLPQMPQMPQMPQVSQMPQIPQLPAIKSSSKQATMPGTWERIDLPPVIRSSHSLDIVSGSAYIFGGEETPNTPSIDNDMHIVSLPFSNATADYYRVKAAAPQPDTSPYPSKDAQMTDQSTEAAELDEVPLSKATTTDKGKGPAFAGPPDTKVPEPRSGHATAVIGSRIFMFGGRASPDMTPIEEVGRVWVFDTRTNTWSYLDPVPAVDGGTITPHPHPRYFHTVASTEHPRNFEPATPEQPKSWRQWALGDASKTGTPQNPIIGNVAEDAVDEAAEAYGTLFVHGGCVANGERTNDLWAFDVHSRTWTAMPPAPGSARSGSAICISKSRLYRFGGYDGESEIGGQLDFLHLELETFNDRLAKGDVAIKARGSWQSILANNVDASSAEIPIEPIQPWPSARSHYSLEALTLGGGREYLVLTMGERTAATPEAPAAFHRDVWTFQVPPQGMTPGSLAAAVWQAMGRKTGEGKWLRVASKPYDEEIDDEEPLPRGSFASAPMTNLEDGAILIWGGLGENSQRLGDGFILRLG